MLLKELRAMRFACLIPFAFLSALQLNCQGPAKAPSSGQALEFSSSEQLPIRIISLAEEWKSSGKAHFRGSKGPIGQQQAVPDQTQYYAIEYESLFADRLRELLSHYVAVIPKGAAAPAQCITYKIVTVTIEPGTSRDLPSTFDIPNQGRKSLAYRYKVKVFRSGEVEPIRVYSQSEWASHMGELVSLAAGKEGARILADANRNGQPGLMALEAEALARSFVSRLKSENRGIQWSYLSTPIPFDSSPRSAAATDSSKFSKSDLDDFTNYNGIKSPGRSAFGGKIIN
jgi:hypothetical protein